MPGSPCSTAPRTRKVIAKSVLPQPAPPAMSVGRPLGSPPPVMESSPSMPLGRFRKEADECGDIVRESDPVKLETAKPTESKVGRQVAPKYARLLRRRRRRPPPSGGAPDARGRPLRPLGDTCLL